MRTQTIFSVATVFAFVMQMLAAVPLTGFFPFGNSANDQIFPPNDDDSVGPISLPYIFPYFNNNHRQIYLANNGLFSFLGPVSQYVPTAFPLNFSRVVAAFWSDIDTRGSVYDGNKVYYHVYSNNNGTDSAVFDKASSYVQQYYPAERAFNPNMIITGTWYRVGAFSYRTALLNTFQIVLATDEVRSFAFILYHDLQWASPSTTTSGTVSGEIGGQAGFNAGDGIVFEMLPYSRTTNVRLLVNISNVNVPGLFIFRIDTDTIAVGGCGNSSNNLLFRPRRGSQLGGTPVTIQGPCFSNLNASDVKCRFGDLSIVDAIIISDIKAICVAPAVALPGIVFVYLSIDGGNTFQMFPNSFSYSPVEYGVSSTDNTQVNVLGQTSMVITPGDQMNLGWHLSETTTDNWPNSTIRLEIQMWTVIMNVSNNGITLSAYTIAQSNITPSNGYQSLMITVPSNNRNDLSIVFFRFVARDQSSGLIYAGLNTALFILNGTNAESTSICNAWADAQPDPSTWNQNLFPCPMTLNQARVARCCYEVDPLCRENGNSSLNCISRRGRSEYNEESAVACYVSRSSNGWGAASECCYNAESQLITRGTGGGTDDRFQPAAYPILHFFQDTFPFYACCLGSSDAETCTRYFNLRPHRRGSNSPNSWGGTWGDPHFITLDGSSYTFNGHGEYTYLAIANESVLVNTSFNPNIQSLIFNAQIRTAPLNSSSGGGSVNTATVIRGFAAKSDHSLAQPMSITVSRRELLIVRRGNETIDLDSTNDDSISNTNTLTLFYPELTLEYNRTSKVMTLSWLIGVSIQITQVSVMINGVNMLVLNLGASVAGTHQNRVFGLLGLYDGNRNNDLRAQNGSIVGLANELSLEEIHRSFGQTWAIPPTHSLFYYENGDSANYYTVQNQNYVPSFSRPQVSATLATAVLSACNIPASSTNQTTWTVAQQTCYYDIAVTNDVSLGQASRSVADTIEQITDAQRSPPEFNSHLPLVMIVNGSSNVTIDFTANSQYSSTVQYTLVQAPSSARFNDQTAVFSWEPSANASNNTVVRVSARDGQYNLSSTYEVVLHFTGRLAEAPISTSSTTTSSTTTSSSSIIGSRLMTMVFSFLIGRMILA